MKKLSTVNLVLEHITKLWNLISFFVLLSNMRRLNIPKFKKNYPPIHHYLCDTFSLISSSDNDFKHAVRFNVMPECIDVICLFNDCFTCEKFITNRTGFCHDIKWNIVKNWYKQFEWNNRARTSLCQLAIWCVELELFYYIFCWDTR